MKLKSAKSMIVADSPATISLLILSAVFFAGCGPYEIVADRGPATSDDPTASAAEDPRPDPAIERVSSIEELGGPAIEIKANSPADTVRAFYKRLHRGQYRDAIKLTNLRPAVEGLTDSEIKDLGVDFSVLAKSVPPEMPINGEIISGETATVTVRVLNAKNGKIELQEIQLRKESGYWVMLVADKQGEKMVRKEGKNYFFALRLDVHHMEAQAMLHRINKAQTIYSLKNEGRFANLETLMAKGYAPADARDSKSTGYNFEVALAYDKRTYTTLATPAEYGKTGKLSFAMKIRKGRAPELVSRDVGGKSLQN